MLHCPNAHFTIRGNSCSHNVSPCEPGRWCMTASAPASRRALAQRAVFSRTKGSRVPAIKRLGHELASDGYGAVGPLVGGLSVPDGAKPGAATMKPAVLARCVRSTAHWYYLGESHSGFAARDPT